MTSPTKSPRAGSAARSSLRGAFVGVRGRLLALVLLALVPALGLTVYRAVEDRRAGTARAEEAALNVAESASRTQAQLIGDAHQLLFGLALLPEIRDAAPNACPRILARLVREFDVYANLGVIALNGDVVCSGIPLTGTVNAADRAYFQRALAARGFAVGDYQIGRITRLATLNVAYPVLERGRVRAVVFAALDLAWLNRLAAQARLPEGSTITVFDVQGTVLARHPDAERWVGQKLSDAEMTSIIRERNAGVVPARGLDGVPRLYAAVSLVDGDGAGDVFLTVGIPEKSALAGANRKLIRDLSVLAIVGLFALAAALAGGYVFLVRPIDRLAAAAGSLGSGQLGARTGVTHAPRELTELAQTFDEMADSLNSRELELREMNETLERRVAERTDELRAVNEELARQVSVTNTVLDSTTDAIALADLEGNTLVANAATWRIMELFGVQHGATAAEAAEQAANATTDPDGFAAEFSSLLADPERESVYEFGLAGGDRWLRWHTGPVRDDSGAVVARIFTTRDVTEEREADDLKSEFVATVSHELRTPLASILGFTELVLGRDLDEETRRRYLTTVLSEARRLTDLINDFLDLQRIEEGSFMPAMESLELGEVLREQVELFSVHSTSHEVVVDLPEESLGVVGERVRIGQVVGNLLSNAIKYSPAGGRVEVRADVRGDAVRVSVSDQGLGIPAEQQERLFTKFFRVDSSNTREIGGTGLGLALAREIVHAHHGHIGFESVEGEGSTFWFELPAVRRGATGAGRILVVEDDPSVASLMSEYLTGDGYVVEIVASGEEALERVLEDPPLLVTLDIGLAGKLDGWQVITSLKADPATASIPVVVCTVGNDRAQAAILGAADFLVKPFSLTRVRAAIGRLLPAGGTVLVADDEENVRQLVREAFANDGVVLSEAADGKEALEVIRADRPDAVILDLLMPKLDGFEVLEQMQDDEAMRFIPVIVLTGKELTADERRSLRLRAFSVLEKSRWSPAELRRLVSEALARAPS